MIFFILTPLVFAGIMYALDQSNNSFVNVSFLRWLHSRRLDSLDQLKFADTSSTRTVSSIRFSPYVSRQ